MGDAHGPNKLTSYLEIHATRMQQFRSRGWVVSDNLEFSTIGKGYFLFVGVIECAGDIVVDVRKELRAVDGAGADIRVETASYSYNAKVRGRGNILRYDGPHAHRPVDHVHRYRVFDGDDEGTIEEIAPRQWPTLGQVLEELEQWYYAHADRLR